MSEIYIIECLHIIIILYSCAFFIYFSNLNINNSLYASYTFVVVDIIVRLEEQKSDSDLIQNPDFAIECLKRKYFWHRILLYLIIYFIFIFFLGGGGRGFKEEFDYPFILREAHMVMRRVMKYIFLFYIYARPFNKLKYRSFMHFIIFDEVW